MKLKLEGYIHQEQPLETFITNFLIDYNENYNTVDEDENLQTCSGKLRSLGDITAICNYYYPDVTKEEVKEILLDLGKDLVGHFCHDISKRIYTHIKVRPTYKQQGQGYEDEYGDKVEYR